MVPLIVHAAAAGGACWARTPTPATKTIAAALTAKTRLQLMFLPPLDVVHGAYAHRYDDANDKRMAETHFSTSFYFLYKELTGRPPKSSGL